MRTRSSLPVGPVFLFDLVRTTRRGRVMLLRCLYSAALLVGLLFVFHSILVAQRGAFGPSGQRDWLALFGENRLPRQQMAKLAESFFHMFAALQFAVVLLVTPIMTGGVIAEERDRKTLEFLLATDLSNREIVLGKAASRLAQLVLLLFTGLPILALVQYLGGVDPNLVLAAFVATAITMLSLTGVSLRLSLTANKPADAVFGTYFWAVTYLLVSGFAARWCSWFGGPGGLVDWFCAGNIGVALIYLFNPPPTGPAMPFSMRIAEVMRGYVLFHAVVALGYIVFATVRLRSKGPARKAKQNLGAAKQTGAVPTVGLFPTFGGWFRSLRPRRPVGDRPVLWKEVYIEPGVFRRLWKRKAIRIAAIFAGILGLELVLALTDVANLVASMLYNPWGYSHYWNRVVRVGGTGYACMILLVVALRSGASISGERDRNTLESLLGCPLTNRTILFDKWLASLLATRHLLGGLVGLWALAVLFEGLSLGAVPLLLLALVTYAGFTAGLGLCFTLTARTTARAFTWIIGILLVLAIGPRFWFSLVGVKMSQPIGTALNPVAALHWLAYYPGDEGALGYRRYGYPYIREDVLWDGIFWIILGLGFFALAAVILWGVARVRFVPATGRIALVRQ